MKAHELFLSRSARHFSAVYETRNTHLAAKRLGISQPALTVSIRKLEGMIGAVLFERSVRGMSPTPAADALHHYAVTLGLGGRFASDQISAIAGGAVGTIRIGAGIAWTTTVLPSVLKTLSSVYPELTIELVAGVGDQLATQFLDGQLDVFLAAGASALGVSAHYERAYLGNLPMLAIAAPQSAIAAKAPVTPRDLAAVDWVGFVEDESILTMANHYLSTRGAGPVRFCLKTNSPTALISFLQDSEMLSVLMLPVARSACQAGLVEVATSEPLWSLPMNLYTWNVAQDVPVVRLFSNLVGDAFAQLA